MSNFKNNFRNNLKSRGEEARIVRRIVIIVIGILLITLGIVAYVVYQYIYSALQPVDENSLEKIEIEIPLGSSQSKIAQILEENEIIKDARIFKYYVKFKNKSGFQAGKYEFSKSQSLDEIIDMLQEGLLIAEPIHRITIPEGKTVDEIAEIYAENLAMNKDEFLEIVNDEDYIRELIEKYHVMLSDEILDPEIRTPLEGYLFPATYNFYEQNPSVEEIVETMLDKSVEVLTKYIDKIKDKDFTVHEAFTFASLLEKEARTEEQRRKIAGVFYNRLETGMKLQTDPTVLYALGMHKEKVLLEDLEVESPYNTYVVPALPVGPISNFAENSLDAVLEPEMSEYLYFLHDAEGNIHYAETHEEHVQLKRKYIE